MFSALKFPVLLTYVLTAMKTSASDVWLSDVLMKYVLVEIAHCSRDHILICIFIDYLSTKNKVFLCVLVFFFVFIQPTLLVLFLFLLNIP